MRAVRIEQADVASLGASLLGIPPPIHNSGVLPVSYLSPRRSDLRSGAAVSNAAQLLSVYRRKSAITAEFSLTAYLSPSGLQAYKPLALAEDRLSDAVSARQSGHHNDAIDMAQRLARECLDGITYLHLYDRWLLMGTITACFLAWIVFLGSKLVLEHLDTTARDQGNGIDADKVHSMVAAAAGVVCVVLALRRSPVTYYAYFNLPLYFCGIHCCVLENFSEDASARTRMGLLSGFSSVRYYRYRCRGDAAFVSRFSRANVFSWMFVAASGVLLLLSGWVGEVGCLKFLEIDACGDECFSCVCDCCPGFRSTRSLHYISY